MRRSEMFEKRLTRLTESSHNLASVLIADQRDESKDWSMFFKNSQPISVGV